jgi:hypothetical protein
MALESFVSNVPENMSILQTTKFTFLFPDMPFLKYFAQTISLPSVSTTEVTVPTPFSNTYRHGDKLNFEAFTITALMDEDLRLWEETYKWIKGLTRPKEYEEYLRKTIKSPPDKLYLDGHLTINTNANRPNLKVKFFNCHPTSLGAINFDTKVDADTIPVCDITFRYDHYEIERI